MKRPLVIARAIPECNGIIRAFVKESSEILRYSDGIQLNRIGG